MPAPKRVTPRLTLSVARGNAVQIGGLLGAAALASYAGREEDRGTRWMVASRLLAYFSDRSGSHVLHGMPLVGHPALTSSFRFTRRLPRPAGTLCPSDRSSVARGCERAG